MSDLLKSDKERRAKIYAFAALGLFAVLTLAPASWVSGAQLHLEGWTAQELGAGTVAAIDAPALTLARPMMESGAVHWFTGSRTPFLHDRGVVIATMLYAIVWRAIYFLFLILLALGPLASAWYDGLRRRKISQWRYEYPSPIRHFLARNTVGRLVEVLLFLAVLPIPMPPVVMLPWLVLMAMALRTWAANMQQRM